MDEKPRGPSIWGATNYLLCLAPLTEVLQLQFPAGQVQLEIEVQSIHVHHIMH